MHQPKSSAITSPVGTHQDLASSSSARLDGERSGLELKQCALLHDAQRSFVVPDHHGYGSDAK
jgi:hypothetical protein